MTDRNALAYVDNSDLISRLNDRAERKAKLGKVTKRNHRVWGYPELIISSWKFNEWDYHNPKAELPTHARGLFTLGEDRILLRGYNKFFNVNEVKTTNLDFLKTNTEGPYAATVKENGCIMLITGLNGKLVVTSKHSSGPSEQPNTRSHARVGREWVLRHLASVGRTEEELSNVLESHNWTAVGELCDDTFEEHVLAYPEDSAGIYLNGLNHNTSSFKTEPPAKVNSFGAEWGFLRTDFAEFADFNSLYMFLMTCAETGKWHSREIEGFVVRCKLNGEDFLFKYKFEEPYLMYRQWREVTRKFLSKGIQPAIAMARRGRHADSSLKFLSFATKYIGKHPELKEKLLVENLGIIDLRQQFLNSTGISEHDLLEMSSAADPRWLLVPVATIGCGKTSVALALNELFGDEWTHLQNDNIDKKKRKWQTFLGLISDKLNSHRVVILDRNNGQRLERENIITDIDNEAGAYGFSAKFVCLNFLPEGPTPESRKVTREMVNNRGDNHQQIKAVQNKAAVNGIMTGFEARFETVNPSIPPDNQFDLIINLEPGNTKENVVYIINQLRSKYENLDVPEFTEAEIDAAVSKALTYKPSADDITKENDDTAKKPRFFAVAIDHAHHAALTKLAQDIVPDDIMQNINIQSEFHVTMAHISEHKKLHRKLCGKYKQQIPPVFNESVVLGSKDTVRATQISWSKNIVAFKVSIEGDCANVHAHITVGTAEGIATAMANYLFDGLAKGTVELTEPFVMESQNVVAYK